MNMPKFAKKFNRGSVIIKENYQIKIRKTKIDVFRQNVMMKWNLEILKLFKIYQI